MHPDLLQLLRCPRTRAPLILEGETLISTDAESRLQYSIRQQIPILIPAEATTLPPAEWQRIMRAHSLPSCSNT